MAKELLKFETSLDKGLNGKQPQWKKTSLEVNLNVRQPQWKTTTIGLTSQFCTELGPAQPQHVHIFPFGLNYY